MSESVKSSPAQLISGEVRVAESPRPLSVFDMFRVGIGPSSSHTVGPMRAGLEFAQQIQNRGLRVKNIQIDLYGSLGATGRGHSTDRAVLLGLAGNDAETVKSEIVESILPDIAETGTLKLLDGQTVTFDMAKNIIFRPLTILPYHVNALKITALLETAAIGDAENSDEFNNTPTSPESVLLKVSSLRLNATAKEEDKADPQMAKYSRTYYSVGGGFVMIQNNDDEKNPEVVPLVTETIKAHYTKPAPYPFTSGAELLDICQKNQLSIAEVVWENEVAARNPEEVNQYMDHIWQVMQECIDNGCNTRGILPGGLDVPRRAAALARKISAREGEIADSKNWACTQADPMRAMEWVNLYALAVNEENAAGHRVVTAPTNGAAGVVPAVLGYLTKFCPEAQGENQDKAVRKFLLSASAIGALIKTNASIAGAEVGCQGEVGSASAMAAAGLTEALGGTPQQVENAAEIAMEHSLGLTCDPIAGLVQVPCIERNAIAAIKAVNAARMALWGDGRHTVSFDAVIETMRQTGADMLSKYKETSTGGLAVNVVEC